MTNIENNLSGRAYIWSRSGPIADFTDVVAYREIPGRELGEEIWIRNVGTTERLDWQYQIMKDSREVCCNRHFESAENALLAAYEWLAGPKCPTLRSFIWSGNHEAMTVDGLPSNIEVTVVEIGPNDWRLHVLKDGMRCGQWSGPWPHPRDALAAYQLSVG